MAYNSSSYNYQRYNINGTYHISTLTETMTEVDGTQLADFFKLLADSYSASDTTIFLSDLHSFDFIFMDEQLQIQFANKALADTIRFADWLSIERAPAANSWFD